MTNPLELPRHKTVSPLRVLVVTGGLVLTGGILGAAVSMLALTVALSVHGIWAWLNDPFYMLLAAVCGLLVGGVLAPITAWLFLRRVPLGKAVLYTTLAAAAGGAIGEAAFIDYPPIGAAVAGIAFLTTAAHLYIKSGRSPS